jgi:hypothetical protein
MVKVDGVKDYFAGTNSTQDKKIISLLEGKRGFSGTLPW